MPNGYDWLFSDVLYIGLLLTYCDILLKAQKRIMSSRRKFRFRSLKLDRSMTKLLREIESLANIAEIGYRRVKPDIIELNRTVKVGRDKKILDNEKIEAELCSVKDKISLLRKQINDFRKRAK